MSDTLAIPGSDIELTDGTIVMLARFPGTKWVVHNGWYTYNGRSYEGWYFSSIPAKTKLPLNASDLADITIISGKSSELDPELPAPPPVPYPPYPPYPPGPHPPGPHPPGPHPPVPPKPPGPSPEVPAFISRADKARYDAAFISLPLLKDRDALVKDTIPDGKIVRVNSVNGQPKYYIWSKYEYEWKEFSIDAQIDEKLQPVIDRVDTLTATVNTLSIAVNDTNARIDTLSDEVDTKIASVEEEISSIQSEIDNIQTDIDSKIAQVEADIDSKVAEVETEVDAKVTALQEEISSVRTDLEELISTTAQTLESEIDSVEASISSIGFQIANINAKLDQLDTTYSAALESIRNDIRDIDTRIEFVENFLRNIPQISAISRDNTVLVSNNHMVADSGYSIGSDNIPEEDPEYPASKTLATERAVLNAVDDSKLRWGAF